MKEKKIHYYLIGPSGRPIGIWAKDEGELAKIQEDWRKKYPAYRKYVKFIKKYDEFMPDTRYHDMKFWKLLLKMRLSGRKRKDRRRIKTRWKARVKELREDPSWKFKQSLWEYFKERLEERWWDFLDARQAKKAKRNN